MRKRAKQPTASRTAKATYENQKPDKPGFSIRVQLCASAMVLIGMYLAGAHMRTRTSATESSVDPPAECLSAEWMSDAAMPGYHPLCLTATDKGSVATFTVHAYKDGLNASQVEASFPTPTAKGMAEFVRALL